MLGPKNTAMKIFLLLATLVAMVAGQASSASGKRQIVLYWGQNTARLPEKELDHFCDTGDYDVIIVSYITKFFASETTRYPGMNLAVHCGVLKNKAYPGLFTCGGIGNAIKKCQARGIKVLLGIKGNNLIKNEFLQKEGDGKLFATRVWNLFLGGTESRALRPFDTAVMDGLNFQIVNGDDTHYEEMLIQFNKLFATDRGRNYEITASPTCGLPSKDFTSVFKTRPEFFSALYLSHDYTENCHPTSDGFEENLMKWVKQIQTMNSRSFKNTKLYLNLVLSKELTFYRTLYGEFESIYKNVLKDLPEFGGVALSDAGWDDLELVDNERYSTRVRELFVGPVTTTAPPWTPSRRSTRSTTTTTTQAPVPRKIAALWGSNLARASTGVDENSLRYFCEKKLYETIIINTLTDDMNDQNLHNLPGLNFANHCFNPMGPKYVNYLRCDAMGHDIKYCQDKGIKILLNIGGSTRFIGFGSRNESLVFARNLWKLFLGGAEIAQSEGIPRTFGSTVLDGINLELRLSEGSFFVDFVKEMRRIMDQTGNNKKYYITANPSCYHPNRVLHEAFTNAIYAFDHLYVNFDEQICSINDLDKFHPVFQLWYDYTFKADGPDLYIGLPADAQNTQDSQRYLQRDKMMSRLELYLRTYRNFGGVLLNDASWDDRNLINNIRYSEDLGKVLRGSEPKTTTPPPRVIVTRPRINIKGKDGKDGGEFEGSQDRDGRRNGGNGGGNGDGGFNGGRPRGPILVIVGRSALLTPNTITVCLLLVSTMLLILRW